jgi:hypothetical protein
MRHYANRSDLSLNGLVEVAGRAKSGRLISRDCKEFDIADVSDVMVGWALICPALVGLSLTDGGVGRKAFPMR